MKFGHSRVKITPEIKDIELQGYGYYLERTYTDILDDIYTSAIYLETEQEKAVLINSDLLNYSDIILKTVREIIEKQFGIQRSNILLITTHTHTAPSVAKYIGCGEISEEYCMFLIPLIIKAVQNAVEEAKEVENISSGAIHFTPPSFNRAHSDGPVDNMLTVLRFELKNSPDYFILNFGCHPVTMGAQRYISADYPGAVVELLHKDNLNGMFLNGFCGDINPLNKDTENPTREGMIESGKTIYSAFKQVLEKPMKQEPKIIKAIDRLIDIDLYPITQNEIDERLKAVENIKDLYPGYYHAVSEWKKFATEKIKPPFDYKEKYQIQALRIGKAIILAIQGEVYTQIGLDIKAAFPDNNIILCGNANAKFGYLPTDNSIEEKDYGGFDSCIAVGRLPFPKGTASAIVKASVNVIKSIL